jgi:hypothetical protein
MGSRSGQSRTASARDPLVLDLTIIWSAAGWPASRRRRGADREPRCVSNARRSRHGRYGSRETPQAGPTLRWPDFGRTTLQNKERRRQPAKPSGQASHQVPRSLLRAALSTDQPLVPLARRRTGVKNGCGTARDVVSFLVRLRPRISLTPGAGFLRGCSLLLRARGLDSSARPRFPGRYRLAG